MPRYTLKYNKHWVYEDLKRQLGDEHTVQTVMVRLDAAVANGTMVILEYDGATFIEMIRADGSITVALCHRQFDRKLLRSMRYYTEDRTGQRVECYTHDERMFRILKRLGWTHTDTDADGQRRLICVADGQEN